VEYTIPAIPTLYRGRLYRSRLEARWAAFFDEMGWQSEYEPSDLGIWSPDFALWGRPTRAPLLVEVKPIDDWEPTIARKMADACRECGAFLLLAGRAPEFTSGRTVLGWLGQTGCYEAQWTEALLGRDVLGRADFQANGQEFCQETLMWETQQPLAPFSGAAAWTRAANTVQFRKPAAAP
jgi:hypothetical protein